MRVMGELAPIGSLYPYVEALARFFGLESSQPNRTSRGDSVSYLHYKFPNQVDEHPTPLKKNDLRLKARRLGEQLQLYAHRRIGGSRYSSYVHWNPRIGELILQKFDTTVPFDQIQAYQRAYMVQVTYQVRAMEHGAASVFLKEITVTRTWPGPQCGIVAAIDGTSVTSWTRKGNFVGEVAPTLLEEGDDLVLKITSDSFGTRTRAAGEAAKEVAVRVPKPASLLRDGVFDVGLAAEASAERLRFVPFIDWGKRLLAGGLKTAAAVAPAMVLFGLVGLATYHVLNRPQTTCDFA